jgi:hypothetical protein
VEYLSPFYYPIQSAIWAPDSQSLALLSRERRGARTELAVIKWETVSKRWVAIPTVQKGVGYNNWPKELSETDGLLGWAQNSKQIIGVGCCEGDGVGRLQAFELEGDALVATPLEPDVVTEFEYQVLPRDKWYISLDTDSKCPALRFFRDLVESSGDYAEIRLDHIFGNQLPQCVSTVRFVQ